MLPKQSKQQGFSLVEIMIASALGLILTGAAIQFMVSSNQTYQVSDDLARVQENGRVAMDMLARDIRMAGYQESTSGAKPIAISSENCSTNKPCSSEGSGNASDTLALQFVTSASASTDCLGRSPTLLSGGAVGDIIVNVYTVQNNDNGTPGDTSDDFNSLYCEGYDASVGSAITGGKQPLVDGIDRMQVLYRVEASSKFEYKSFDRLAGDDFINISAIRIGLLVSNGQATGKAGPKDRKYQVLDSPNTVDITGDTQVRRIYTTTIQLNNRHAGEKL